MNDKQQYYNDFYSELEKAMEPSGGKLQEMDMPNNNGFRKGIIIKFDNISLAPIVYPDFYYQDWKGGKPVSSIVFGIRFELMKTSPGLTHFNIGSMDRNTAVTHLYAGIVSYESNKEWLEEIPHERVGDLAVFAKWRFDNAGQDLVASAKVTEPLLAHMQLTKEEALKIAKANTGRKAKLESVGGIIAKMLSDRGIDKEVAEAISMRGQAEPFQVLTTDNGIDGAAVIACPEVLKEVQKQMMEEYYILPCSINEVLILPKSQTEDVEGLKEMVSSINKEEIEPKERLSDNIYEFDGHSLKLAGAELTQEYSVSKSKPHHRSR